MTDPRRTRLDAVRAETAARIVLLDAELDAVLADRAQDNADDEHDPEGVPLSAEWSMLAGVRAQAARTLADIDAALALISAGGYGVCADCGDAIPEARLEARPTAVRCVACAEKAGL